jgi:DNA-binding transcriptional LysR family regulator
VTLNSMSRSAATTPTAVTLSATNSETVAEMVRTGQCDLGFVEGPNAPRGCRSRVIARDSLVVVVPSAHPWAARRTPLAAETLAHTPLATREPGSGTRDALETALRTSLGEDVEISPPVLELSTTAAVRTAVLAGAGPAVLSALVVADDVAAGRLHTVAVDDLDLTRSLRAVWLGDRTPPAGPVRDLIAISARQADQRS